MPAPAFWPLVAALTVTGLNALKPAVVDDAAYLRMADHLAQHPLDPYGFEQFWYARPQPAFEVLAPPVVPYLLAGGVVLFGDALPLIKLALFPVIWLFSWAAWDLLRRFAPGHKNLGLLLVAGSPAVLPLVNAMLDIPAAALSLGAVALVARGTLPSAVLAGLAAGVAFQTKYSAAALPAVLAWHGLLHRRVGLALVAVTVAVALAAGWEVLLARQYGRSHFLFHAAEQAGGLTLGERLEEKLSFARPLVNYLGLLGCGWGLVAGRAVGLPRWCVAAAMAAFALGLVVVICGPLDWVRPGREPAAYPRLGFTLNLFGLSGLATLGVTLAALKLLLTRPDWRTRRDPESWFLAGWLAVEVAACLALTPFPAGRRVVMISLVIGLVALRLVALRPGRSPGRGVVAYCVGLGVLVAALDYWDARPERELVAQAAAVTPGHAVWTQGGWGWQHYARKAGFHLVVPGASRLLPGDWLVLPTPPPADGFFRPNLYPVHYDEASFELMTTLVADDALPYATLPGLYGGPSPIWGRDFPRLTVNVYRVARATTPTGP